MSRSLLCSLFLTMFAASADDTSFESSMRLNKELWSGVKTVEKRYRPPPKSWTPVDDAELKVRLAFPCDAKKAVQVRETHRITTHTCAIGRRSFLATFEQLDPDAKGLDELFHAGSDYGFVQRAAKSGGVAKVIPTTRLSYHGVNGRQARLTAPRFDVDKRTLVRSGLAIMLMVSDQPGHLGSDSERFFDTLQFK